LFALTVVLDLGALKTWTVAAVVGCIFLLLMMFP